MIRLADIREAVAREGRAVLVLVAEAQGSAPREAGAAMLVAPSGPRGTVGGGTVEQRAVEIARAMLAGDGEPTAEVEFPLGPALDQCCGGRMRLAFALLEATAGPLRPHTGPRPEGEGTPDGSAGPPDGSVLTVTPDGEGGAFDGVTRTLGEAGAEGATRMHGAAGAVRAHAGAEADGAPPHSLPLRGRVGVGVSPARRAVGAALLDGAELELWPGGPVFREPAVPRQVVVYGAGHVGTALVRALAPLPFRLAWVDARAGACAAAPAGVAVHETPLPEEVAQAAEADALHVVLTHSHALDLEIVTAVMRRPFGFCGLIGSATKRATFRRRLAERGVARAAIDRLTCPLGLAGLRDKRPAVIAASAAAQLLQVDAALAARRPVERAG